MDVERERKKPGGGVVVGGSVGGSGRESERRWKGRAGNTYLGDQLSSNVLESHPR